VTTRAEGPSIGRRWGRFVLRAQGRLDGETVDRFLPWVFAAIYFAVLALLAAASLRALEGGSGVGAWVQAAWRREHGGAGFPVGGVDPASGSWSLISEPVLWAARILPAAIVLSVVQALALALGIVPLWRLARDEAHLRVGASTAIITAYVLAPTLHRTNLSAFHPEAIALPALIAAYLHGRQDHPKRLALFVVLVLACRADLGLTVAALGLLLAILGKRRPGFIVAASGLIWVAAAVAFVGPELPTAALTPSGEFVARSIGPLAVVPELFTDPFGQLRQLLTEPSIGFLVVVLAPLLFLPLVSPRKFSGAVPCLALAMIADTAVQQVAQRGVINLSPAASHIAPAMAFVFIALVFALERIGDLSVTRVNVDRRVLLALVVGASLLFVAESPSSPYRQPWAWGSQDAVDGARLEAADLIDDEAAVAVSPASVALVAARADLQELPLAPADLSRPVLDEIARTADVVLLDTSGTDPLTQRAFWSASDVRRVRRVLAADGFTTAYDAQGVVLMIADAQPGTTSG